MLEKYNNQYEDLEIIAVNLTQNDQVMSVVEYIANLNYSFSFIMDPDGEISNQLRIEYIPYVVLLDEKGFIQYKGSAPFSVEALKEMVNTIQ